MTGTASYLHAQIRERQREEARRRARWARRYEMAILAFILTLAMGWAIYDLRGHYAEQDRVNQEMRGSL